jgi:hypothetical protein
MEYTFTAVGTVTRRLSDGSTTHNVEQLTECGARLVFHALNAEHAAQLEDALAKCSGLFADTPRHDCEALDPGAYAYVMRVLNEHGPELAEVFRSQYGKPEEPQS